MDGMWESAVISYATFWEIQDHESHAGHFCLDINNGLLRFHLVEKYQAQAQDIFHWIISAYGIQYAMTSTIEPLYFSVCLNIQKSITPQLYLFRDHRDVEFPTDLSCSTLRKAEQRDLDGVEHFYRKNTEGAGEWIEAFLRKRLDREELFVWYHQQTLVATGECTPSQSQSPYADLGMVVDRSYRGKGLGSATLLLLKKYCYKRGWKPICSCAVDNHASKKAIEKAGFLSEQRIVKVTF